MYRRRFRGLTIVELLAVVAIAGVFLFLATINFGYFRGNFPNSRLVCGSNLKGIGLAAKIYANDNDGLWPVPSFDESANGLIDYTVRVGGGEGSVRSPSRSQPSSNIQGGARQLSVTRAYWMLVRAGDVTLEGFVCPQSGDTRNETVSIESYYDFTGYHTVSYGYQVPFGPFRTRARDGRDNKMVLAADKGPYRSPSDTPPPANLEVLKGTTTQRRSGNPKHWQPYNSRNHGGDGQNVLFADGHAEFRRTPTVGIDHDNIYTIALDNQSEASRATGESPWARSAHPLTVIDDRDQPSSTDSVIFP